MKNAFLLLTFLFSFNLLAQQNPVSIGTKFELKSNFTDYDYKISVYTPRNYEKNKGEKEYPVAYLFLGNDDMFHAATGMIELMSNQRQIPEMIVVGITNISWWPDLTPDKVKGRDGTGGGADFLSFVSKQLIPKIDKEYSTNDHRIYLGHSLGGMYGVYMLTDAEPLFDDLILISPSIVKRADSLFPKLEKMVKTNPDFKHDIYITMGSNEGDRIELGLDKVDEVLKLYQGNNLNWKNPKNGWP